MSDIAKKPPHPMWGALILVIILSWVTLTMWLQASKFDSTEGRAIGMIAAPLLASWGYWFYRHQKS